MDPVIFPCPQKQAVYYQAFHLTTLSDAMRITAYLLVSDGASSHPPHECPPCLYIAYRLSEIHVESQFVRHPREGIVPQVLLDQRGGVKKSKLTWPLRRDPKGGQFICCSFRLCKELRNNKTLCDVNKQQ